MYNKQRDLVVCKINIKSFAFNRRSNGNVYIKLFSLKAMDVYGFYSKILSDTCVKNKQNHLPVACVHSKRFK
jgi:hypothetical protein